MEQCKDRVTHILGNTKVGNGKWRSEYFTIKSGDGDIVLSGRHINAYKQHKKPPK